MITKRYTNIDLKVFVDLYDSKNKIEKISLSFFLYVKDMIKANCSAQNCSHTHSCKKVTIYKNGKLNEKKKKEIVIFLLIF